MRMTGSTRGTGVVALWLLMEASSIAGQVPGRTAPEIVQDLFALELIGATEYNPERAHPVRARAVSPWDGFGFEGVEIAFELWDWSDGAGDQSGGLTTCVTDQTGECEVELVLPWLSDGGEIEASVEHLGQRRSASLDLYASSHATFVLSTDRSMYRPGDEIHIRTLGFWPDSSSRDSSRRDNRVVVLVGRDEQNQEAFREELELSEFGVAATSWALSEERPPREIHLSAQAEGVTRYRFLEVSTEPTPRFALDLELDQSYYLPGDTAVLTLAAASFSGVSVAGASASVFVTSEGEDELVAQSTLDAQGHAEVSIPLSGLLSDEGFDYRFYEDVELRVVVDDPNSAASESRQTVLRASRDPLHVYLNVSRQVDELGQPVAWVTCFEADGAPRRCDVEIRAEDSSESLDRGPLVGRAITGRFGVGQVVWTDFGTLTQSGEVALVARDEAERVGGSEGWVSKADGTLALRAPVLQRYGDPLRVEVLPLVAGSRSGVRLEVWGYSDERYERLGVTEVGELSEPKTIDFGSSPSWSGMLSVVAFDVDEKDTDWSYDAVAGLTHVLVVGAPPARAESLDVQLSADASEYQPGSTARVSVRSDLGADTAVVGLVAVDADMRELERIRFGYDEDSFLREVGWDQRSSVSLGTWTVERLLELPPETLTSAQRSEVEPVASLLLSRVFALGFERDRASPLEDIAESGRGHFDRSDAKQLEAAFDALTPREVERLRAEAVVSPSSLASRLSQVLARDSDRGFVSDIVADHWGTPYRLAVSLWPDWPARWASTQCQLTVESAGLDRTWSTVDDHLAGRLRNDCYEAFNQALQRWLDELVSSGEKLPDDGQLLPPDFLDRIDSPADLGFEVGGEGVLDPWSNPLRMRWSGWGWRRHLRVTSTSGAPSARGFSSAVAAYRLPDPLVREIESRLRTAVNEQRWPRNDEQLADTFATVLGVMGLDAIYDPWGEPIFPRFDRLDQEDSDAPRALELRSSGNDLLPGTKDDIRLARLGCLKTRSSPWARRIPESGRGTAEGVVVDHQGFALPGATVEICGLHGTAVTISDGRGRFTFRNWPAGPVTLVAQLDGFASSARSIEVEPDALSRARLIMFPATEETITVTSEAPVAETSTVSSATTVSNRSPEQTQIATPRVRRDFRDTLIFVPEQTLEGGQTEIAIPLADDVTSWSVSAIVSTRDGRMGTATTDIPVRLPLWIETRWPRRVTAGDRLSLPVQINQRVGASLDVEWEAHPSALDLVGRRRGVVEGSAASETVHLDTRYPESGTTLVAIDVRARDGKLADSVEQELRVDPDGFEREEGWSGLVDGTAAVELATPGAVLDVPTTIEVKVYADLMDHVVDAIRGLVRRPVGCMEQVLSTAQGSLLALELLGDDAESEHPLLFGEAKRNVELALRQLARSKGIGSPSLRPGGVAYWSGGSGDVALSAYALDFLQRSSTHVSVYEEETARLVRWLVDPLEQVERELNDDAATNTDAGGRLRLRLMRQRQRMLVAWSIARYLEASEDPAVSDDRRLRERLRESVRATLRETPLDADRARPYLAAVRGLTALALGDEDEARTAGELLAIWSERHGNVSSARQASWPLAGTTPFWGRDASGRVEATGLAVQLLARLEGQAELARAGAAWLLENKLTDGAWSTTQATVQALRALVVTLRQEARDFGSLGSEDVDQLEIQIGERLVTMPASTPAQGGPRRLVLDVSTRAGEAVELGLNSRAPVFVQVSAVTWVPWSSVTDVGQHERLDFDVDCGRGRVAVGETVSCRAEITRSGSGGMLVAEIGIPPGVQVDRSQLRAARGWAWQWSIDEARVLAYVYPDRGRATLEIGFRPLMPFDGKSTSHRLWDYYDPDAKVVLPPGEFRFKRR